MKLVHSAFNSRLYESVREFSRLLGHNFIYLLKIILQLNNPISYIELGTRRIVVSGMLVHCKRWFVVSDIIVITIQGDVF